MGEDSFGTIKKVDPRAIWANEAGDFTPWLASNLKVLGDVLGFELELTTSEAPVGGFSLDLLGKDLARDRTVIIENQLSVTDHDHLGKLLTYASGYDAAVVVWIATELREEHRQAIDWLNARTDSDTEFFAVVLEVITIDDSAPAVQLRPVATPNTWRKERARASKSKVSSKGEAYRSFFPGAGG